MSASDPDSTIDMLDTNEVVIRKLKKANSDLVTKLFG